MDLIGRQQAMRRASKPRGHARAIFHHVFSGVARADAAVEGGVDALRDAPGAGEETVTDSGERAQGARLQHHGGAARSGAAGAGARASASNPGSRASLRCDSAMTLNSSPMPVRPASSSRSSAESMAAAFSGGAFA